MCYIIHIYVGICNYLFRGAKMKIKSIYLIIVIIIFFSLASWLRWFGNVEYSLQDSNLQSSGDIDSRVVILGIDEDSLKQLKQWPWPRNYIAEAIGKLSQAGAAAIGLDVIYSEEARNPEEDKALVEAVKNSGKVVIPVYGDFEGSQKSGSMVASNLIKPFKDLNDVALTGHINTIPDKEDGIVRNSFTEFNYNGKVINSFAEQIYRLYMKNTGQTVKNIDLPKDGWNRVHIAYAGEPDSFECLSFYEFYSGKLPADYFKDKIVLIGPYAVGLNDSYVTPLDHRIPMYGVEIHANILQNYLYNSFKSYLPDWFYIALIVLLGFAGHFIFRKIGTIKSLVIVVLFSLSYVFFFAKWIYSKGYILQVLYPVAIVSAIYIATIIYKYIEEYLERKRVTQVFGRYVAPEVVKEILENGKEGIKLGGSKKEITALFVDIRGFTPLSEKAQPEEVVEILNEYLNLTATSIFRYGGTLDKFIGDATMAIFNAPLELPDHAFKAVLTAWAMKQGAEGLEIKLVEKFGRGVQFGIGINTGDAVVGNIGAAFRMDYTAIGDTVNTAARLESNAKPGQIILSQSTYELVKDRIDATYLGGLKVKGKEQEIPVYQVDGIKQESFQSGKVLAEKL